MKYSFMSFSSPTLDFDQTIKIAKDYGYEGFEPRISAGHMHGIEVDSQNTVLRAARAKAEDSGLRICCIATSCSFANPATAEDNINLAKRSADLASEVNSPVIRVFGGNIPEGVSREKSFETIVSALIKLSDYAAKGGVLICMETHDSWCDPIAVAEIMKSVNNSAVAVNWDIMHPVLTAGYTVEKAFEILNGWIRHVHVHDGFRTEKGLEFRPIGEGAVDHRSAVKLLKESHYDGYISGEWINWEPYDIHLPREINIMRKYEE